MLIFATQTSKQKQMLLPLVYADKKNDRELMILAGDVGGTKTNLALYTINGDEHTINKQQHYQSDAFDSLSAIFQDFLSGTDVPDALSIGVPGPVINGKAKLTNLPWEIDTATLAKDAGISEVFIINDLESTAYGLAMLKEEDLLVLHPGATGTVGNIAVIAPGTGLGEAGLYYDGSFLHPFATEGGHCDFAPRSQVDISLYVYLEKKFGHVSWERVVCGPGIVNIYEFLRDDQKMEEPDWLAAKMKTEDPAKVISESIADSELCAAALQAFIRYLAYESANLVLKIKATGGLYIGGGIAPKVHELFKDYDFYNCFCSSGRLKHLLEQVPVNVILNDKTALLGAAYYGSKKCKGPKI